jgi:hypothetical protein
MEKKGKNSLKYQCFSHPDIFNKLAWPKKHIIIVGVSFKAVMQKDKFMLNSAMN